MFRHVSDEEQDNGKRTAIDWHYMISLERVGTFSGVSSDCVVMRGRRFFSITWHANAWGINEHASIGNVLEVIIPSVQLPSAFGTILLSSGGYY